MMRKLILAAAFAVAACGQPTPAPVQEEVEQTEAVEEATAALPEVDPAVVAAPNSGFVAIEPTEIGVIGAPSVREALGPLILDPHGEDGSTTRLTLRESADETIADIVRSGLADDSVAAGHVRIEFRREPDGWYPTNAYQRWQCRRGDVAGQWSASPCP